MVGKNLTDLWGHGKREKGGVSYPGGFGKRKVSVGQQSLEERERRLYAGITELNKRERGHRDPQL